MTPTTWTRRLQLGGAKGNANKCIEKHRASKRERAKARARIVCKDKCVQHVCACMTSDHVCNCAPVAFRRRISRYNDDGVTPEMRAAAASVGGLCAESFSTSSADKEPTEE